MSVDAEFLKLFEDVADLKLGDSENSAVKTISERDIVAAEYKEKSPFSLIYRDHYASYGEFIRFKKHTELDAYLKSEAISHATRTPTFLIKSLINQGLVMCHLQHKQVSLDCVVVDVLVRTHGDISNVFLSTTVYLVFSVDGEIADDDIMDTKLELLNHVFDIRSVSVKEQLAGQNYASKKGEKK